MKHDGNIQMSNIEGEPSLSDQSVLLLSALYATWRERKRGRLIPLLNSIIKLSIRLISKNAVLFTIVTKTKDGWFWLVERVPLRAGQEDLF